MAEVHADRRGSRYLDFGDWFAGGCLAACIGLAAVGLAPQRGNDPVS